MVKFKKDDLIKKIVFNIRMGGKFFKDVTLEYDYKLTWEMCHYEDAETWNTADLGDEVWDFQFSGYDDSEGMKTHICVDACKMYKENPDVDVWSHTDEWLSSTNAKITNVRYVRSDGIEKKINIEHF